MIIKPEDKDKRVRGCGCLDHQTVCSCTAGPGSSLLWWLPRGLAPLIVLERQDTPGTNSNLIL